MSTSSSFEANRTNTGINYQLSQKDLKMTERKREQKNIGVSVRESVCVLKIDLIPERGEVWRGLVSRRQGRWRGGRVSLAEGSRPHRRISGTKFLILA